MDTLGSLYTKVCDYLWNGSETYPQVKGIKEFGVKPFNFIRWDNPTAEARFQKKPDLQPADMPEIEVLMPTIRPKTIDSCGIDSDIGFTVRIASGAWKITNATKLQSQVMALLSILMYTSETCQWDIGKPYADVGLATVGDGRISRDPEINKNMSGFTFEVGFTVKIKVQYLGDEI